jgi:hypothetical protein
MDYSLKSLFLYRTSTEQLTKQRRVFSLFLCLVDVANTLKELAEVANAIFNSLFQPLQPS